MHDYGRYEGELILKPLEDGRLMQVMKKFGFIDSTELGWPVPLGTRVDGASIPRPLWSFVGGPFEGKYRDASVVHDYYCDVRKRQWKAVHRVFYDAMLVSGTPKKLAKLMYAAVYFGGPRWTDQAVHNNNLGDTSDENAFDFVKHTTFEDSIFFYAFEASGMNGKELWRKLERQPFNKPLRLNIFELYKQIEMHDPSIEEIERAMDMGDLFISTGVTDDNSQNHRQIFSPYTGKWKKLDE